MQDQKKRRKAPLLGVKFDGDPQQLGFFPAHVLTYMQEYRSEIRTEGAKVRCITLALEGAAARWMATLHSVNTPELRNFDNFMTVLHHQFEDPPADQKARGHIKIIREGCRAVAEYTNEFRGLACYLDCCFKDELNDDLYNACVARRTPSTLHNWCVLAEEVEIDQAPNKYCAARS